MDKVLTITIPSYNAEKDLPVVLGKLVKCKFLNSLDIIVVNDGSSDNTSKVAKKYEKMHPMSIKVIDKENGGHGSAINTGIKYAKGKYFKVVDSDDWLSEETLEKFIKDLEMTEEDVLLNPFWTFDDKTKKIKIFNKFENDLKVGKKYSFDDYTFINLPSMHSFTFKTTKLVDAGFKIDEHAYYVDVEYILFPLVKCKTFKMLGYPLYYYRINQGTQSVSIGSMKKNKERHEFVLTNINKYIKEHSDKISTCKRETMINRLSQMIAAQFKIISLMPISSNTFKELKAFDKKVKNELLFNEKVINRPIKFLLESNFWLLPIIHCLAILKMKTVHV
ncbi:glycosyltransferase family A protein [Pediococcus acidilactici]|uniref:glycosyltransferase family 2 protein n=1 Tax=Pediococcus acidilactici TaxID=1254 RepID=UPI001058EB7C|nr:glycosyltransferase family A protein [Pediococcus acidilactici]KAF0514936.1 glycosyltransferase [Pediococcus acidilactici]MCT3036809.1 glycosyltransferase family 2 protein [Pediococcus acidilactici]QQC45231.1 glycosyltransferase family 2 protein [Pediococcus acidilactici]